ncbi:Tn3-like element ISAli20 family transposase [Azospirillum lipoferum]|uniref:Transposase of ISAli20, Tn3 family n=1 Tax=Azospirillum lipoferum (strain 4B) TaxID=862719 RepID=G7ZI34_AZOL4|nr:Tn3-like element ISAli20 family transposase [Azospirillum lipoferum]CBS91122.1 Transposase of ISAli20, Tn3 family [Azospirillum lipoferum 4B]
MARRQLLTEEERRLLFGLPTDRDALARHYTFTRSDLDLIASRRGNANRLGFAVQLALLRYPGLPLPHIGEPIDAVVGWVAEHLELPVTAFAEYARRSQTMTDHARDTVAALGLRFPREADLPDLIEAAAQAAWISDQGMSIMTGTIAALRSAKIVLPSPAVIERAALAGRARARKRAADALVADLTAEQRDKLDKLLAVDPATGITSLTWLRTIPTAPKADHVRDVIDKLHVVRGIGIDAEAQARVHETRFRQFAREGMASPTYLIERCAPNRRRATLVALLIDLENRLTDAALDMADKLIGGAFTRAKNNKEKTCVAKTKDVGRLMRLFHRTIEALSLAQESDGDAFALVNEAVGWPQLLRVRGEVASLAELAEEDPLVRAADRYVTIRKFAPALLEALTFKAARSKDPILAAVELLKELNRSGKRDIPADAPMLFRKEWRRLVTKDGKPNRRLYETAVLATLRNKLRSGDVWVERSSNYRRFDSYLLPAAAAAPISADLTLPATAEEWLGALGRDLDEQLKRFAQRLRDGQLEGVELRDERLHIAALKATAPPEADVLADRLDALLPRVRITELLHEVNRATGFAAAFTNLRTGESCDNENALLAVILADGTNLGLTRMAEASQGVTRDQLIWTADACIRPETYQSALARIIDAHHRLPMAAVWGGGTTSSSDGQFFRSGKRGNVAGEVNARYGGSPGFSFYTHVSDQHGPYHVRVISAAAHEAPYVLDGLLHHGTGLKLDTHYVDTGGTSDHVFILAAMLGFRFCPRLRDFPERRLASIEPSSCYPDLQPLLGRRVKVDVIREHWNDVVRLVASLKAGTVAPSTMLKKLAAYERQNQLDLALQELGRIERTLFMIRWLETPELRRSCHIGLNKGEQRHALAQAICTFKQGRIADRGSQAQQYRASGLNLLIAAIVYWNSTYMADAVGHLRAVGGTVPDDLLVHTSPVGWEHIGLSGDFLWGRAAAVPIGRRPLNLRRDRHAA